MCLDNKISWLRQFYSGEKLAELSEPQLDLLYQHSQPQQVCIKDLEHTPVSRYRIFSADGYVPAVQWRNKGVKPCVRLSTATRTITASRDHFFEMADSRWKYAAYIVPGELILTDTGPEAVVSVVDAEPQEVFDFHIDHENHRYYTAGISSHNSGAGKSLFLANLGVNWALQGLNVVYMTLELSEELVSMRIDSMTTGIPTRDIFRQIDDVELKVRMLGKKSGTYQVKYLPSGKTANDVRSFLKEYEVKLGRRVDILLIDYLDLLMPNSRKISAENLYIKDKYVSEELRNLAMEKNCVLVTASQLNRGAVEEVEFDHSHISGGLSKIQTADNVFGIFTSRSMREQGRYQIQLMKTRNSSGVGSKVDLDFDVDTLRITSTAESAAQQPPSRSSTILTQVQKNPPAPAPKVRAQTGSTQLRQFLSTLDSSADPL